MKLSPTGLDFIKGFESFVPWVYDDLGPARKVNGKLVYREWNGEPVKGTPTIGYGHTNAARHLTMNNARAGIRRPFLYEASNPAPSPRPLP